MKHNIIKLVLNLAVVTIFASCTTTKEITSTRELENFKTTGEVTIVTKDSSKYVLNIYTLKDSVINGKGTVEIKGVVKDFDGKIKVKDLIYAECQKTDLVKTIAGVGSAALISYITLKYLAKNDGVTNTVVIRFPTGGGCN
jgi:hypothetical protein